VEVVHLLGQPRKGLANGRVLLAGKAPKSGLRKLDKNQTAAIIKAVDVLAGEEEREIFKSG